jgi:alkanesulfonate monooxygenase SsuD/methylene tetrahydromethanopterin reductase-like flavin-dependent oxidoreductase (luciferase family)
MITLNRQLLSGTPDEVRHTMEDLARDQDDHEYLDGTRFRELAVKLAMRHGLTVSRSPATTGRCTNLR